jgi:hypothetical protein
LSESKPGYKTNTQVGHAAGSRFPQVQPFEAKTLGAALRTGRQKVHDGKGCQRFAAPRFTNQGEGLPSVHGKGDIPDGL